MAPRYLGDHAVAVCKICDAQLAVESAAAVGESVLLQCSSCGQSTTATVASLEGGGAVSIVPTTSLPQRWSVVAFEEPHPTAGTASRFMVKRLVGLPGEKVHISQGDVWVNGRRVQKDLAEFDRVAIPLLDSFDAHNRWGGWRRHDPARWRIGPSGLQFDSATATRLSLNGAAAASTPADDEQANYRLSDDYPFNLNLSRRLKPIADVWVELVFDLEAGARLELEGSWGSAPTRLVCAGEALTLSLQRGNGPPKRLAELLHRRDHIRLGCGYIDGRLLVSFENELVWEQDDVESASSWAPISGLSLVVQGAGTLRGTRVLRDVYYLEPYGAGHIEAELASDECYLIGDNSPVSEDSRHYGPVATDRILGLVLP